MKYFIMAVMAVMFLGCANKAKINCPDCNITNGEYSCTGCKIEAEVREDFKLLPLPNRGGE